MYNLIFFFSIVDQKEESGENVENSEEPSKETVDEEKSSTAQLNEDKLPSRKASQAEDVNQNEAKEGKI